MASDSSKERKPAPRRKRARTPEGHFKGDNPATPDLNEAWVPTDIEAALPKKSNPYEVKPKVTGTGNNTAGKYAKKGKTRPTFGKVTTTYN